MNKNKIKLYAIMFFLIITVLITSVIVIEKTLKFLPVNTDTVIAIGKDFDVVVSDNQKVWNITNDIDVFNETFWNEDGNIYIENTKGKKVLAPGSKGSYSFKIHNAGEITLNYTIDINASLEINNKKVELSKIPLRIRIKDSDNNYYLGNKTTWVTLIELDSFLHENYLKSEDDDNYILEYFWLTQSNQYDTLLGKMAKVNDISLVIQINTLSTSDSIDNEGIPVFKDFTSNNCYLGLSLVLGLVLMLLLGVGIYYYRKKITKE